MMIGGVELKNNVFLAPMAGITDRVFRGICCDFGAGAVYSEMVSAKGLYYNDKKTASLMDISGQSPCAVQIFGSEPEIMAEIIPKVMTFAPDFIDINMGCPAPKIVNNGDGSALMKRPELMGRITRAVADASPVPVTVKIRKGWETDNSLMCAHILEENGAAAIAVHGRTRKEFYSGKADWAVIKRIKSELRIPVIGNGDIYTAQDALRMMNHTGCDGVMVARGAQGNPWIFIQIGELIHNGAVSTYPTPRQRVETALMHTRLLVADKGENRGIKEARKHIAWYIKGLPDASQVKSRIFGISDYATIKNTLSEYIDKL